eukprot:Clim_evm80s33 gene=Clim_evmTU80s33
MNKMTILWGPLLQAPYYDPDVDQNDLNDYVQKLYAVMQGTDVTPCASDSYDQGDGIPYAVAFPLWHTYNAALMPNPDYVQSTWWTMDYTRVPMHAQYDTNTNSGPSCDTEDIGYEKDVALTTSATNSYSISDSFTMSMQSKTSTSVSTKLAGIGASVSEELTVGFSKP